MLSEGQAIKHVAWHRKMVAREDAPDRLPACAQDDDGTAYIAYSSEGNRVMHIGQLTADYRNVGNQYLRTMVPCFRPARLCRRGMHDRSACLQRAGHGRIDASLIRNAQAWCRSMGHGTGVSTPSKGRGCAQVGMAREAPAMFKHQGIYFMLTSACTGWHPNRAEVFYARRARTPSWAPVRCAHARQLLLPTMIGTCCGTG